MINYFPKATELVSLTSIVEPRQPVPRACALKPPLHSAAPITVTGTAVQYVFGGTQIQLCHLQAGGSWASRLCSLSPLPHLYNVHPNIYVKPQNTWLTRRNEASFPNCPTSCEPWGFKTLGGSVWGKRTQNRNTTALVSPFLLRRFLHSTAEQFLVCTPSPPHFFSRLKRGRGPFKARPSLSQNFPVSALFSIPDGRPGSPPSW